MIPAGSPASGALRLAGSTQQVDVVAEVDEGLQAVVGNADEAGCFGYDDDDIEALADGHAVDATGCSA